MFDRFTDQARKVMALARRPGGLITNILEQSISYRDW